MNEHETRVTLIESLRQFAKGSGPKIDGKTQPISDLELKSEDGIAWAVELELLGFKLPLNANPFIDDKLHRERNLDEIVDLLLKYSNLLVKEIQ